MLTPEVLLRPGTVLLDAARDEGEDAASLLFRDPVRVLAARRLKEVPGLLRALDRAVGDGWYAAGFLAYEAGGALEPAVAAPTEGLLGWFGLYRAPERLAAREVEGLLPPSGHPYRVGTPRLGIGRAAYREKVRQIKRHIRAGDVYQVNFTDRVTFPFSGSVPAFYGALRRQQRVSYGALLALGEAHILSLSPELFFRREGDRIEARPMKGTLRRGRTASEDERLSRHLAQDEKSRAENLMIVDLLRNDLSICCRPGTVRVPALFTTERYETLFQMTSTIEGRLREEVGYAELFRALFPCGSVTGAPKIRAMQTIRHLEREPRGVYCGTIGYAAPGARACFSVAIRTLVLREGQGEMGVGSGVVWDSDADAEYDECLLKARFLSVPTQPDFRLIETMRWEGSIALLEGHLARLRRSARRFGFPLDEHRLRDRLRQSTEELPPGVPHRVRLTLDRGGACAITTAPLEAPTGGVKHVTLSRTRVDSRDPLLRHKTTRRDLYERAYREARDAGFDEVLFLNERGEVTEGSRTNVFIREGGVFYTPPLESGVLPGVFRAHLLGTLPKAAERVLHAADVERAEAVYVCNAVWGLQPALFHSGTGAPAAR